MRFATTVLLYASLHFAAAQVHVDRPIQFTAADSTQRQVLSLGAAQQDDALITLGAVRSGALHVATVAGGTDTLQLSMEPTASGYVTGLSVRFTPVVANGRAVWLDVDGLGPRRLVRPDGLAPSTGQFDPGVPVEAIYMDSVFVLTSRALEGCPSGFLPVNARFCFEVNEGPEMLWYDAVRYCGDRGARLCAWDEYYHACTVLSGSLNGLFDTWEWMDDTADHSHTAGMMGRYTCESERTIAALDVSLGNPRCCYRLR